MSLSQAYEECRLLNRHYGTPFFHSINLIPRELQPHVNSVFAFDRILQQMIYEPRTGVSVREQAQAIQSWQRAFERGLRDDNQTSPYLSAAIHTVKIFDLDGKQFSKLAKARLAEQQMKRFETSAQVKAHLDATGGRISSILSPLLQLKKSSQQKAFSRLGRAGEQLFLLFKTRRTAPKDRCYLAKSDLQKYGYTLKEMDAHVVNDAFRSLVESVLKRIESDLTHAQRGLEGLPEQQARFYLSLIATYRSLSDDIRKKDYNIFVQQPKLGLSLRLRHAIPALGLLLR